jgi:hypothetical protein
VDVPRRGATIALRAGFLLTSEWFSYCLARETCVVAVSTKPSKRSNLANLRAGRLYSSLGVPFLPAEKSIPSLYRAIGWHEKAGTVRGDNNTEYLIERQRN